MKNLTLQRVAAIDVSRALTMFLMLFVNDIPGLKNIPYWLRHAEVHAPDGYLWESLALRGDIAVEEHAYYQRLWQVHPLIISQLTELYT